MIQLSYNILTNDFVAQTYRIEYNDAINIFYENSLWPYILEKSES